MAEVAAPSQETDAHSYSRPDQVRVEHVDLDLTVDFASRRLRGTATLRFARPKGADVSAPLILDTNNLTIESVRAQGHDVPFEFGPSNPILGRSLTIRVPAGADQVEITYATSPQAKALQWLDPPQTAGKKHPFLFSQSQAIQARTWVPIQDSPGVRVTYTARLNVPEGLVGLMAADKVAPQPGDGPSTFRFRMSEPIPSYLMALAVGNLEFRTLGKRTGVYAEPSVAARAAHEFAETEAMVEAAEKLFGEYRWKRYDLLVLPPSFPFGGMENPKLTFATPTILAGDRSLVSLVAHELAHSWSGNLVTNATWRDFWLNEGFTVYFERRIIEALYGPERAAMEAMLGLQTLKRELAELPAPEQILHINLTGRDPDDGVTQVPYEKGALFLTALEQAFGRERFDRFLRDYFDKFAFRSITTQTFVDELHAKLLSTDPEAAKAIDLETWLERPGLPPKHPEPKSARFDAVEVEAKRWLNEGVAAKELKTRDWTTHEWLHFLEVVADKPDAKRMAELDAAFGFTRTGNSEIVTVWLKQAIRAGYSAADARLEEHLVEIGRRKLLMPLYQELLKQPGGRDRARALYAKARPGYHPIAVETFDKLLGDP